jgi:hypothetical protein
MTIAKFASVAVIASTLMVSGCATAMVTGAVVGTAATATKIAVKTTVGAGKLAYKGTKAVVKGTGRLLSSDDEDLPAEGAR